MEPGLQSANLECPDIDADSTTSCISASGLTEEELDDISTIREHDLLHLQGVMCNIPVRILIDGGCTHDVISRQFVQQAQIPTTISKQQTTLTTADGKVTTIPREKTTRYEHLYIGEHREQRRFHVADIHYDVILGKPWLTHHNPHINWRTHVITLPENEEQPAQQLIALDDCTRGTYEINCLTATQFGHWINRNQAINIFVAHVRQVEDNSNSTAIDIDKIELDSTLTASQQQQTHNMLREFQFDVFAEPTGLPPHRNVDHHIPIIPGSSPTARSPYPASPPETAEAVRQIKHGIEQGWIQPSTSPYSAPVLFVKKKNGTLRMCIDYRALNNITIKNKYPLPRIADLLDRLSGARYFTSLDLRSGYHQLRIDPADVQKTAFSTSFGHYEYTVMPFGLTNAPASFQQLMNDILRPHLNTFVIVYLDDILIFSRTFDDHIRQVQQVLRLLRDNQLHCNMEKCSFVKCSQEYLGHVVDQNGLHTDPRKTAPIAEWPTPRSVTDVQQFMGLANYFRKFIPHFASVAAPLTDLLRGDNKIQFIMTIAALRAFDKLKQLLTSTPILALPDFSLPFIVTVDACGFGLGAMLSQIQDGKERVIAFESRKLRDTERLWSPHEQEGAALVYALKTWRHYLDGHKFTVYTDHQPLKYLLTQPKLNQRQARWVAQIQSFDLDIIHKPGRLNAVADALSRRPDYALDINTIFFDATHTVPITINTLTTSLQLPTDMCNNIINGYKTDRSFSSIYDAVKNNTNPALCRKYALTTDGLLVQLSNMDPPRLCIPDVADLRLTLVRDNHDATASGHFGFDKTYRQVSSRFYWPSMSTFIKSFCASCEYCQRAKGSTQSRSGLLAPLPVSEGRWETITMDFITGLPKTARGYDCILTVTDKLTKRSHFIACHTEDSAVDIANIFIHEVFRLHGIPKQIVTDRDTKFTSSFWTHLQSRLGTTLLLSSANHPQTDGQSERTNRTIEDALKCFVNYDQDNWDTLLSTIEFAYNNAVNSSTGFTPFFADLGRHPRLPQDWLLDNVRATPNETANTLAEQMTTIGVMTRDALLHAQDVQVAYYNRNKQERTFNVGDLVLIDLPFLQPAAERLRPKDKLKFRRLGPFPISAKLNENAYRVTLPASVRAHNVFNVTALTHYRSNTIPDRVIPPIPPVVQPDGTPEYIVEKILRHQRRGRKLFYLVQWLGYPHYEATWEPRDNFLDHGQVTTEALREYEQENGLY